MVLIEVGGRAKRGGKIVPKKHIDSESYMDSLREYLQQRGWLSHSCTHCGSIFFTKENTSHDIRSCGWRNCQKGIPAFLSFPKPKKQRSISISLLELSRYFRSKGFQIREPEKMANRYGKTDLTVAGVQMFDKVIHQEADILEGDFFIAQPCIRTQFQSVVASTNGSSTAFVNICTEKMGGSFEQHLFTIDHWLTALSKLGLHMNDFVLVLRTKKHDWGSGEFYVVELFFIYGDLELGDAGYSHVPQQGRASISLSDIGFGLERVTWGVNKQASYFDFLRPFTISCGNEEADLYRSITLMLSSGVQPSNKGPGLQLRRFAKLLSGKHYHADIQGLIVYYYNYWKQFGQPVVSVAEVVLGARLELDRTVNFKMKNMLGLPMPKKETTEQYINRVISTCNVDINKLREAFDTCLT